MRSVTKEEFFKALSADPRDIMPHINSPEYSDWETKGRVLFGRTYPGWKNPGDPEQYLLAEGETQ